MLLNNIYKHSITESKVIVKGYSNEAVIVRYIDNPKILKRISHQALVLNYTKIEVEGE